MAADNPHANKPMVQMMAVFAEMERDAISKRTKEALAAAKARGVRLGNPRLAQARAAVNAARQEAADSFAAGVLPIIRQIQKSGISSLRSRQGIVCAWCEDSPRRRMDREAGERHSAVGVRWQKMRVP